jgi:hypothetical protein
MNLYLTECGPVGPVTVKHVIVGDEARRDPRRTVNAQTDLTEISEINECMTFQRRDK